MSSEHRSGLGLPLCEVAPYGLSQQCLKPLRLQRQSDAQQQQGAVNSILAITYRRGAEKITKYSVTIGQFVSTFTTVKCLIQHKKGAKKCILSKEL